LKAGRGADRLKAGPPATTGRGNPMRNRKSANKALGAVAAAAMLAGAVMAGAAVAQEMQEEAAPAAETADPAGGADDAAATVNEDEMADSLNANQQLQQSVTLRRRLNGELVETETRTITYDRATPTRPTEAGPTVFDAARAAFDKEALTRSEAVAEAELDFSVADLDRNGALSAEEFTRLLSRLGESAPGAARRRSTGASPRESFIAELDQAADRFTQLAGPDGLVSQQEYKRRVSTDFDYFDGDRDGLLAGEALADFRAARASGLDLSVGTTSPYEE